MVYARVDEIVDANYPLCDIEESHCRTLHQSFCKQTFDYACGVMTGYVSAAINPAGATYVIGTYHADGKIVFKDDCSMLRLHGHRRRRSVELVREEDHLSCAAEPLRMRYVFRINGKRITPAKAIKVRKIRTFQLLSCV